MHISCEMISSAPPTWRLSTPHLELVVRAKSNGLSLGMLRDLDSGHAWAGADGHSWLWLALRGVPPLELRFEDWQVEHEPDALCLEVRYAFEKGSVSRENENSGKDPFPGLNMVEALWVSDRVPAVRHWITLDNPGQETVQIERYHLLDLAFGLDPADDPLELFYVDAFAGHRRDRWDPGDLNFGCHTLQLGPGASLRLEMGAYQAQCSWIAARRPDGAGLAMGLEYDGAVEMRVFDIGRLPWGKYWATREALRAGIRFAAGPVEALNATLGPGKSWRSPAAFIASFSGQGIGMAPWDSAAHVTHKLVERHLALPWPDDEFPYVAFNTWGYAFNLSPKQVWRCLDLAAEIGAEVFEADYGWMNRLGEWVPVERNFPPLRELSQSVHARGMKFGLWMSFANTHVEAPVAIDHPDWLAYPDAWGSFGSRSLCMAHPAAREWAAAQTIRVAGEMSVDHFKHDFELITPCTHPGHDHPPDPAGYYSMLGYQEVLTRLRQAFPGLVIENCEGGGRIMTYDMVKWHHTSITSDGPVLGDALARRAALYGACFPFPLRYCDNYMEERPNDYACHSSMIGGPWILMSRATEWTEEEKECARRNIELYKRIRPLFRDGFVYHLRMPDGAGPDGFQVQQPSTGQGAVYLFQPHGARQEDVQLALAGLHEDEIYQIRSSQEEKSWEATGASLMSAGLNRRLAPGRSEILLLQPA